MKIGIYCDDISPQEGGASTLTKTIITEIQELKEKGYKHEFVFLYSGAPKCYLSEICGINAINVNYYRFFFYKFRRRLSSFLGNGLYLRYRSEVDLIVSKEKIDLIWMTVPRFLDISIPYIFTVWDLGHRTVPFFSEVASRREWHDREYLYSRMIPRATWILTGNECGKKEILANYSIPEDRIIIAPFPVSSFCYLQESKPISFDLSDKYFFYPAQFWPHKNHVVILYALKILADKYNLYPNVYFIGSEKGNMQYIQNVALKLGIDKQVIITGFLTYEEVKYMYTHATAMIYSSLMGPNNLPPIEATFLGCPVIISDLVGHREQLGDSALYFKGTNELELAVCMKNILNDIVRDDCIANQKKLRQNFSEIKYCAPILSLIEHYDLYLRCWKLQ